MDALNILALGLASKGGGGGGTTYTAGDNIDITNDEISVTEPVHYGIDLESPEEDGDGADYGVNGMMTANISTNYDEHDEPIAIYARSNAVDNSGMDIMDAELLGYTKMNEARYGVSGISIENGEIFDPTTGESQSFNFSVHSDGISYGWSSNDGQEETSSSIILTTEDDKLLVNGSAVALESDIPSPELPTISSGDAGKVLTVNSGETGVEWAAGGGGSSYTFTNGLTDNNGTVS